MPERIRKSKMTVKEQVRFVIIRSIGNFLLLFALYGVAATFGPILYFEVNYRVDVARGITYRIAKVPVENSSDVGDATTSFGSATANAHTQILVPPDTEFSIVIPKIGASSRVIPNVDPTNEAEFLPALQKGVAHAKGTVFPGMNGNVYLFSHSTDNWWNVGRYNAVFYLLKELNKGDDIAIFFEDRRYNYVVKDKIIADPTEVTYLVNSRGPEQKLILQTCWPPGTTWKRLFIIAEPKAKSLK